MSELSVNRITILPLRDMVLVELQSEAPQAGLQVIRESRAVRPAKIIAIGPEVRDLAVDMVALVNTVAATSINGCLLVPQQAILGTL
jgi:hypothetical protein